MDIFEDDNFWARFGKEVILRSDFSTDLLTECRSDVHLYPTDEATKIFEERRNGVRRYLSNPGKWLNMVMLACLEISRNEPGEFTRQIKEIHCFEALEDFVEHLKYFYVVARIMESSGVKVTCSPGRIHDACKLSPMMLVAYSEKFQDGIETSLWQKCLNLHYQTNPHHQQHAMWKNAPEESDEHEQALRELLCDKTSRALQKQFGGKICPDMWHLTPQYYNGLPDSWLAKASELAEKMKEKTVEMN